MLEVVVPEADPAPPMISTFYYRSLHLLPAPTYTQNVLPNSTPHSFASLQEIADRRGDACWFSLHVFSYPPVSCGLRYAPPFEVSMRSIVDGEFQLVRCEDVLGMDDSMRPHSCHSNLNGAM
jgi:hypothetical protein